MDSNFLTASQYLIASVWQAQSRIRSEPLDETFENRRTKVSGGWRKVIVGMGREGSERAKLFADVLGQYVSDELETSYRD